MKRKLYEIIERDKEELFDLLGSLIKINSGNFGDQKYLDIFGKILDYCKTYFADGFKKWYGYLRRDGKPTESACKGSTFKDPFRVPRCLIMVDQMLGQILQEER